MRFGYGTYNPLNLMGRARLCLDNDGGEGGESGAGGSGEGEGGQPFSVTPEAWQETQNELAQLRADRERLGGVEKEFGTFKERFKPFLEGGQGGHGSEDREPDQNDTTKYPRTQAGAQQYIRDLAAFQARQIFKQHTTQAQASEREQSEARQETERTNKLVGEHMKRVAEVSKVVPDFDKVTATGLINIAQHAPLAKAILRLKNSAMVEYHLAKNPQEAMQLIRTAAVDMDEAREVLFNLNYKYSEEAKKSAARKQAERAGGYTPTATVEGEHEAGGDDAADEDWIKNRFGLGSKK